MEQLNWDTLDFSGTKSCLARPFRRLRTLDDYLWLRPAAGDIPADLPQQLQALYQLCGGGVIGDTDLFGLQTGVVPTVGQMRALCRGEGAEDVCFASSAAGELYFVRRDESVYRLIPGEGVEQTWTDLAAWLADIAAELRQKAIAGMARPLPVKRR